MATGGNLNQAQRIAFVSNNPSLLQEGRLDMLADQQIGIFEKKGGLNEPYLATSTPEFSKVSSYKIIQGTKNRYNSLTSKSLIPNIRPESVEFRGHDITGWTGIKARRSTKEDIVTIGFDGVDVNKSLVTKLGQKITFYLYLTGSPINRLTNHTRGLAREYMIDPACIADCENPCGKEACQRIQQALVKQIEADKWNNIPITSLIKVSTITKCTPEPPAVVGLIEYTYWCVSQCDEGEGVSLGLIQSQYPNKVVTRTKRKGSISSYQFIQKTTDAVPADLTNASLSVFPNCKTCPTGYTYKDVSKVFEVKVPCNGAEPVLLGKINAIKVNADLQFDTWQVYVNNSQDVEAVIANATGEIVDVLADGTEDLQGLGTKCISVIFIGVSRDICTLSTPTLTKWEKCGTCKKAPKTYNITLKDDICGNNKLVELQKSNPSLVISIAPKGVGTCVHKYETTVYSNCVEEGCTVESLHWTRPESFGGIHWEEASTADAATLNTTCNCGIQLEGYRFEQPVTECTLPYFGFDMRFDDSVHIQISNHSSDYTQSICEDNDLPFTVIQTADYASGMGRSIIQIEEESMSYFLKSYSTNPVIRDAYGYNYNAKPDVYYDEYQLSIRKSSLNNSFFGDSGFNITYRFFFPEGTGKQFENAINTLVTSGGLDTFPLVVL